LQQEGVAINGVVINAKQPMCAMHHSCGPDDQQEQNWQGLMAATTALPLLQDSQQLDVFGLVGKGLLLHDDLFIYDRHGQLFAHICSSTGMAPSCQYATSSPVAADLLSNEGYSTVKALAMAAAWSDHQCATPKQHNRTSADSTAVAPTDKSDSKTTDNAAEWAHPWEVAILVALLSAVMVLGLRLYKVMATSAVPKPGVKDERYEAVQKGLDDCSIELEPLQMEEGTGSLL